jgi:hypothetical protein
MLDICLPFSYRDRNKNINHWARFILLNRRIIGIRIRTGLMWNRYRCEEYRLPEKIIKYYKENIENVTINTCLIGDFYLNMRDIKIAPLFSSEIEQNMEILTEY